MTCSWCGSSTAVGRNLAHLVNTVQNLSAQGVGLRVHTGQGAQVDTTTASGRVVFGIFAALAEFERELIGERTVAGLKAVRARGRKGGRKLALSKAQVRLAQAAMANRDTSVSEPCRELGIKPVTLCRYVGPRGQKVHLSRRVEATDFGLDAGDPAWSLLVLYPLTASRRALPALNAGAFEAAMVIGSPVCGLGPCRAVRARVENVPNPAMATVSPLARASEMVENTASMTLSAAPLDREASAATRDESSDLWKAPKSVGSNGETVFRLKGERAFEVDVWTFNRRCRLL